MTNIIEITRENLETYLAAAGMPPLAVVLFAGENAAPPDALPDVARDVLNGLASTDRVRVVITVQRGDDAQPSSLTIDIAATEST